MSRTIWTCYNGSNRMGHMIWPKWWPKWYRPYDMAKMIWAIWYGQNDMDQMVKFEPSLINFYILKLSLLSKIILGFKRIFSQILQARIQDQSKTIFLGHPRPILKLNSGSCRSTRTSIKFYGNTPSHRWKLTYYMNHIIWN